MTDKNDIKIIEHSWRARIAARVMKTDQVAIVFGDTIHLWGTSKKEFLGNERWLKHELKHVEQYERYGYLGFITKYLIESILHGYENNRFEKEAREAENNQTTMQ